jgi:hypothetical protein
MTIDQVATQTEQTDSGGAEIVVIFYRRWVGRTVSALTDYGRKWQIA